MTVIVGVAVLLLVGLGGWRIWTLHAHIAELGTRVEGQEARVEEQLDELWRQVGQSQREHAEWVAIRLQRADTAAIRLTDEHGRIHQRLLAVEAWVRLWARAARGEQR